MQTFKLFLMLCLAGGSLLLNAQPASPERQRQALELLRQTLTQQRQPYPDVVYVPGKPTPPDLQQQAIQRLRQEMEKNRAPGAMSTPLPEASGRVEPVRPVPPAGKAAPLVNKPLIRPSPTTEVLPISPAPEQPAGPKTKQQRLMDLLEEYKADKLTPAEYQVQRAKILAEP